MSVLPQGHTQTIEQALVVVADAGMLSAANLSALDEAGVGFIVGARTTRAPGDLEAHLHWHGDAPADGQVTRHHHPQKRLRHRAGQEPQGRACLRPGHPSRLVEGHLGLLIQALYPGQPHTGRPGQQGQGHPSPATSAPSPRVLSPPARETRSSMRHPWPGPGAWLGSRATSPTFLHA